MIVVTGAKGFIGKNFVSQLKGEDVFEVDLENCASLVSDEFTRWDDVSLVLHQGAISSTTTTDLAALVDLNISYSLKIFEKCIEYQIPVKYASSASIYGDSSRGSGPLSMYASSKQIVDLWVAQNIDQFRLIQGFRYFNVFGFGESHKVPLNQASPVATFFNQALKTGEVRVFEGSESFLRDFVWVGDLVDIVLHNTEGSGIYDLGTGEPTSFLDVANAVARRVGVPVVEVPMPSKVARQYQPYTKASYPWIHQFKTVGEFIEECDLDQWSF